MEAPLLEVRDLRLEFSTFRGVSKVVDGANLTINNGETVVLAGETGCGKSLIAKAILRLIPSPPGKIISGEVFFKGKDLLQVQDADLQRIRGKEIALVPQDPMLSLNPVYTIEDQILTLMLWQSRKVELKSWLALDGDKKIRKESKEKALAILNSMRIASPELILKRYPIELSGGMRQRVLIAMALLGQPKLLIADEPGTALDSTVQDKIIDLLKEKIKSEHLSTLYITHDLATALKVADKIAIMYAGRIVEFGNAKDVFQEPLHPYTVGLLRALPRLQGNMGDGIPGMIPDYVNPPSGCRFNPRCDHRMPICEKTKPEMIEVRPSHFTECYLYSSDRKI
jgi:oligopeptide/dipeptide ABC transporter ATP-binding protein